MISRVEGASGFWMRFLQESVFKIREEPATFPPPAALTLLVVRLRCSCPPRQLVIERKCAPLVASAALRSAKDAREEGGKNISRRREFPFFFSSHSSPPSLSFVYLFSLSICPSRISSPPPLQRRVARTGLDDTRRIPHLLKGSRHGGVGGVEGSLCRNPQHQKG